MNPNSSVNLCLNLKRLLRRRQKISDSRKLGPKEVKPMEVQIVVPAGTDIGIVNREYPDIYQDAENIDELDTYFIGQCTDDDEYNGYAWLDRDEAIECCGFVEGAISSATTLIEGNGDWVQEELRKTQLFKKAHNRGKVAAG